MATVNSSKKIKLSDYVVSWLEEKGVKDVFMISGGGIMHLVDSVGRAKKLKYICNQHEQAAAIAAESYARLKGLGVCIVTTGPGGTNTITGVSGAWLDSVPMLVIGGQVNLSMTAKSTGIKGLRQLGDQEENLVQIMTPITKYAATVEDPRDVDYHLEKALYLATHGRCGPVFVEIPLNIQGSYIQKNKLRKFVAPTPYVKRAQLKKLVRKTIERLRKAKRPVLLAGNGIRWAGADKELLKLLQALKIPVLTSVAGYDLVPSNHRYYIGRPGTFGQRAANFVIQNSDFLLSIGSRLHLYLVTYNYRAFAREAFKVIVDVDPAELKKPTIKPDIAVHADAKEFIEEMLRQLRKKPLRLRTQEWWQYARELNRKYPVVLPEYWKQKKYVNSYCFIDRLSRFMKPGEVIVVSDGTPLTCSHQALIIKKGQRLISNLGCAAMGYGLPAAIGACFANKRRRVICLEGDGSIQLNLQEFQTIQYHNLPIKIFIYENEGYLSIKITQDTYMNGRRVASDPTSGVGHPDFVKVARAYGFRTVSMNTNREIDASIRKVLAYPGPVVCVIRMAPDQPIIPKSKADKRPDGTILAKPLEDMYPFLDRKEFLENMIIRPWER